MKFQNLLIGSIMTLGFAACGGETKPVNKSQDTVTKSAPAVKTVLEPTATGPEYPNATLGIKDIKAKAIEGKDSFEVTINYSVENYELKTQTSDAGDRQCNNSKEGQHIHFILDNQPYVALYEPTHTFVVGKNQEHVLLSFLSRSYHLSLKNKEAHQLLTFKVNDKGEVQKLDNSKEPMLFYSRPKGTYIGNDTKELLMDFYLVNADLQKDDLKVVANYPGGTLDINEWKPFVFKGLPMGKHNIELSLVKKDGSALANNKYAKVSREITLSESEPIKN